uniref:Uncharacterized protein n=1 Tax=Attheya septentrionalis TaxID=420275 RepID=A0A7S2UKS4_9STRA|mmetsp:Transcript_26751/g.48582  ORF Transcript_26751/g.48582 Transcript_26751/m.48582 type:complete len:487 (+) Transcript_26751:178-1638(+)
MMHNRSNNMSDPEPERVPFPFGFQFSHPARYHDPEQTFQVGDLVWYEIKGNFSVGSKGIQWGEGTVKHIHPEGNLYTIAGKAWNYDHKTHPLIGVKGGPPMYNSLSSASEARDIYRRWAQNNHPNFKVKRAAMMGKDEVMHPSLRSVPREAMFKVWDRDTIPTCPIIPSSQSHDGERDSLSLEEAQERYGPDLQYKGAKQDGYGPEMWGITLEQLMAVKELPGFEEEMLMLDVVTQLINPYTKNSGMGYSLLLNKDKPLRAKIMTSHAWGEKYAHFVTAIKDSGVEGPFWCCAMAIYQCEDIPELAISKQLGPDLENGPFATVLKQATDMIAVFTPAVDIYLRMWCVYEIFVATKYGVPLHFAALNGQFRSGLENIYDAIYEHGKRRCDAETARCGNPDAPMNSDETQIRALINDSEGKFDTIDSVVEWCKAIYHIGEVRHPGVIGANEEPAHLILLGGSSRFDYLAKTLSSVATAIDRIPSRKTE